MPARQPPIREVKAVERTAAAPRAVAKPSFPIGNQAALRDRDEVAADRIADAAVRDRRFAGTPAPPADGAPLPSETRAFFEPRLATDLGDVRVHHGPEAARATGALGAAAFTAGDDVSFAAGRFDLSTARGLHLVAHELAHVAQQRIAGPSIQCRPEDGDPPSPAAASPIAPVAPLPATPLERRVTVETPRVLASGAVTIEKTDIVYYDEVSQPTTIALYATPRAALDGPPGATGPLTPAEYAVLAAAVAGPTSDDRSGFGPTPVVPATPPPQTSASPFGLVEVEGDFVITDRFVKFAVGAGSCSLREANGKITLIDVGVGNLATAAITRRLVRRIKGIVGTREVEVLISHLHADHTNALPELAKEIRIGSIRINAYQFNDPRMLELLMKVVAAQAERVERETRADAEARRATLEAKPTEPAPTPLPIEREAAWRATVDKLVAAALEKSSLAIEIAVPQADGLHIVRARVGEIALPETPGAPMLLRRGFVDVDPATGLPRLTLVHPDMAIDLRKLLDKQASKPFEEAPDELADAHENTYVIPFKSGSRLFVMPDKRARDIGGKRGARPTFLKVLLEQVAELNVALDALQLPVADAPYVISAYDMTHHAQRGWFATVGEMNDMAASLRRLVRLDAGGGRTTLDVVLVSGQGDPRNPAVPSKIDPATVWFLRQNGVEVIITTGGRSAELIEIALRNGKTLAVVTGTPYPGHAVAEATLRRTQIAIERLQSRLEPLDAAQTTLLEDWRSGKVNQTQYRARRQVLVDQRTPFVELLGELEAAREKYQEQALAELRPAKEGGPAQPAGGATEPAAAARLELQKLLSHELLAGLPAEPGPAVPILDPVGMRLIKRKVRGPLTPEQKALVEAVERSDVLRAELAAADTVDARAKVIESLSKVLESVDAYARTTTDAPTKMLLESKAENIRTEIAKVATPAVGGDAVTTRVGDYVVTQRSLRGTVGSDRVRRFADKTTPVFGGLMVLTTFMKQGNLEREAAAGEISDLTATVGTLGNVYGVSIGLRMLAKVHISPVEFGILAVFDFAEAATRDRVTPAQYKAGLAHSALRGTLQMGLMMFGGYMMKQRHWAVALAGFLLQFGVDPALNALGVYDRLERTFEFLPNDVFKVLQRVRELTQRYAVISGMIELGLRSDADLTALGSTDLAATRKTLAGELAAARASAIAVEKEVLDAFAEGYKVAETRFAGLAELDEERDRFLVLQAFAHGTAPGTAERSRAQVLAAWDALAKRSSMRDLSVEQVRALDQWDAIRAKLVELRGEYRGPWERNLVNARRYEGELQALLRNARYRLEPTRTSSVPMLPPGPARDEYVRLLADYEQRAEQLHDEMIPTFGTLAGALGLATGPRSGTPADLALDRVDDTLRVYRLLVLAMPALPGGLTAERMRASSFELGETYRTAAEGPLRESLLRLELIEAILVARFEAAGRAVPPTEQAARDRLSALELATKDAIVDRRETRGYLYASELAGRIAQRRSAENAVLATQLGATLALSPTEAAALRATDSLAANLGAGVPRALLDEVPYLSLKSPDGYMVSIFRYVDDDTPESANVLLGDTRRYIKSADLESDLPVEKRVYVCLNDAARKRFAGTAYGINTSTWGHAYLKDTYFYNETKYLKRVKLEDVKP